MTMKMDEMNGQGVAVKSAWEGLFPSFGKRVAVETMPTWDEGRRMFITDEYESANGHRYYCGVRISNQIVIVEHIGLYHTWTYLDGIDVYRFEGEQKKLVGQKKYEKQFYNADFVREESKQILHNFAKSQMAMQGHAMSDEEIAREIEGIVSNSYQSLLDDKKKMAQLKDIMKVVTKALPAQKSSGNSMMAVEE